VAQFFEIFTMSMRRRTGRWRGDMAQQRTAEHVTKNRRGSAARAGPPKKPPLQASGRRPGQSNRPGTGTEHKAQARVDFLRVEHKRPLNRGTADFSGNWVSCRRSDAVGAGKKNSSR
jgi:hypothetical protein